MSKRKVTTTPGSVFVRGFRFVLILSFAVPWIAGLAGADGARWRGAPPGEAAAQLRSIERRLDDGEARRMEQFFPEGRLFSYSFYGFTLVNLALVRPDTAAFRRRALQELERIVPLAEKLSFEPPFDQSQRLAPRGGVIPAAHANLLRAGYAVLGGGDAALLEAFHRGSRRLHDLFMESPTVSLETYPGRIWPVDNVCALESLRLHDVLFGTGYGEAGERWAAWMKARLDPRTGLLPSEFDKAGQVVDGPRGCALSWALAFLHGFAPELAREQYGRYRETWFIHILGTTGVREWPPGVAGHIDADTGPVVAGVGAAASGLGIAAAKANGDMDNLGGLLRGVEFLGFPTWNVQGEKEYFFGGLLLADILDLWGKTIVVWDRPQAPPSAWPPVGGGAFWIVLLVTAALGAGLGLLALLSLGRAWGDWRKSPRPWSISAAVILAAEALVALLWLLLPAFSWLYAVLLLGTLNLLERGLSALSRRRADGGV